MSETPASPEQIALLKAVLDEHCNAHGIEWGSSHHDEAARALWSFFCQGLASVEELLAAMRQRNTPDA